MIKASAIARWSYSLYLVNFNLCTIIAEVQSGWARGPLAVGLAILVFLLSSFALAAAAYRLFEAPILRQRSKILAAVSVSK